MKQLEPIYERLERLRKQAGLSAAEMARLIDVPESTYREWENGRGMKLPPFQKISEVLSISVTELIIGQTPELDSVVRELESIEKNIRVLKAKLSSRI